MTSRDPAFCREFVARAKEVLARHPNLAHSWSIDDDEDHCVLDFPEPTSEGFPVTVQVFPEEITVAARGYHQHFPARLEGRDSISDALALVRDLLSPGMRIREHLASGSPYRWQAEILIDGAWQSEGTTGLFFWSYFGKKSERFYQNQVLPIRNVTANQPVQTTAMTPPPSATTQAPLSDL